MVSVRDSFFNTIYELTKSGEDIYIITADLGAPSLDEFRRDFPERYISIGIAEQSLVAVAAGLALGGKKVIAYGLNPFPVTRAFDQVRILMAEQKIPITLCALNAGLCSAECGYTHMPIEDIAMLRTLSNVEIVNPTDETISRKLAKEIVSSDIPRVIRFDKALNGCIYNEEDIDFRKGYVVSGSNKESKVGVVTSGCYAREIRNWIAENDCESNVKLLDLFSLPVDEEALVKELMACEHIVTIEENVLQGGIGSMILEILSDKSCGKRVKRMGLDLRKGYYDVFTGREYIRKEQQIDIVRVGQEISRLLCE